MGTTHWAAFPRSLFAAYMIFCLSVILLFSENLLLHCKIQVLMVFASPWKKSGSAILSFAVSLSAASWYTSCLSSSLFWGPAGPDSAPDADISFRTLKVTSGVSSVVGLDFGDGVTGLVGAGTRCSSPIASGLSPGNSLSSASSGFCNQDANVLMVTAIPVFAGVYEHVCSFSTAELLYCNGYFS